VSTEYDSDGQPASAAHLELSASSAESRYRETAHMILCRYQYVCRYICRKTDWRRLTAEAAAEKEKSRIKKSAGCRKQYADNGKRTQPFMCKQTHGMPAVTELKKTAG